MDRFSAPTLKGLPPTDSPTKRLGSLICGLSPWRVSGSRVFPADTEAGARALRSVVECLGLGRLAEAEEGEEGEEGEDGSRKRRTWLDRTEIV